MTEEIKQEVKQETAEAVAEQAPQSEAPAQTDLNINDLAALRGIVDVASQRGAFKANELEAVGKIYNKLSAFLDQVTTKKE
jgi:hypothetical protein